MRNRTLLIALFGLVCGLLLSPVAVSAASKAFGFNDVGAGNVHGPNIQWAKDNAVTSGCGSGNFCPDDNVPREQMVTFMRNLDTKVAGDISQAAAEANAAASWTLVELSPDGTTSSVSSYVVMSSDGDAVMGLFKLPPNYETGAPISLDVLFFTSGGTCNLVFAGPGSTIFLRPGSPPPTTTGSMSIPATSNPLLDDVVTQLTFGVSPPSGFVPEADDYIIASAPRAAGSGSCGTQGVEMFGAIARYAA